MSFYIYQLVEPLISLNTLTSFSAINYKSSTNLSAIHYFYQTEPKLNIKFK